MNGISRIGGTSGQNVGISAPLIIHGYKQGLAGSGTFYVKPNLPGSLTEIQKKNYAKQISACFSAMAKKESPAVGMWTQQGIQISLYQEVIKNGNYRVLEKDGKIAAILLFKVYERGVEADNGAVRLVNEVADRSVIDSGEFAEFLNTFCEEMRADLGARLIISQEKKGDTLLSRILLSIGFRGVEVDKEPVQYKSYQTSNVYAIYQKELV